MQIHHLCVMCISLCMHTHTNIHSPAMTSRCSKALNSITRNQEAATDLLGHFLPLFPNSRHRGPGAPLMFHFLSCHRACVCAIYIPQCSNLLLSFGRIILQISAGAPSPLLKALFNSARYSQIILLFIVLFRFSQNVIALIWTHNYALICICVWLKSPFLSNLWVMWEW